MTERNNTFATREHINDVNDPAMTWIDFLNAKTKGEMEMLAAHDASIKKAYDILEVASKAEKARMAYEARQAEIMEQMPIEQNKV
nr:PD-(D/E)XK nuclease family transposase [uncultured Cellulosilyticum sp.]